MTNPYKNTPTARFITDRVRDLSHRKTQSEIAAEAGFVNANFMSLLKSGKNKVPLDRVPEHFTASLVGHQSARSENRLTYSIYSAGISDEQKRGIIDRDIAESW